MNRTSVRRLLLTGAVVATTALAVPMTTGVALAAPSAPSAPNRVAQTPDPTPGGGGTGGQGNTGQGSDQGQDNGPGNGQDNGPGNGQDNGPGSGQDNGPGNGHTTGPGNGQDNGPGNGQGNGQNNGQGNGQQNQQQADAAAAERAAQQAAEDAKRKADEAAQRKAQEAAQQAEQQAAAAAAQQAAEQQAKQAAQAAEAAAKAQARAAKEAAQRAAAAQRANVTWVHRGRPNKMVIIRPTSIDSVAKGELVQRVVRNGRSVTPAALDAAIPTSWMSVDGDTARLSAAVVMTPGTLFDIEGIQTLQLAGGANAADAAWLYTGSGRIQTRGVTVTSVDPATGQAVAADLAGRPYIRVSDQGRLDTTDTTITDLGTAPKGDLPGEPAVGFGSGSSGTLTGTTFQRNSTGLMLAGSQAVKLQDVTVSTSTENGLVLREDTGTVLAGIKAENNGDNGVLVTGKTTPRPISGISTTGNKSYGVSLTGQQGIDVTGLTLNGDQAGGLELNRVSDTKVHDITTSEEPNGVFLHVNSTNVQLDAISVNGGRTGVVAEKTTKGLHLTGGTIDSAHVAGLEIGGHDTLLDGLTVKNSRTAVRVERGAGGVTANKLSLVGGDDGLVTSGGTTGIAVADLTADGVGNDAIRNLSPGLKVTGGEIRGGNTGMDLQAGSAVSGMQIGLTSTGIRARATDPITLDNVAVDAVSVGVESQPGGAVTLRKSSVHALEAVRGVVALDASDDLSLPPLNLLGAIGLPLIVLAVVLEALHLLRQRRFGPRRRIMPPAIPVGAS